MQSKNYCCFHVVLTINYKRNEYITYIKRTKDLNTYLRLQKKVHWNIIKNNRGICQKKKKKIQAKITYNNQWNNTLPIQSFDNIKQHTTTNDTRAFILFRFYILIKQSRN